MVYVALVLFVLASFALGIYASRSVTDDLEGYFMGGRNLNKWAVGISAGATGNSGFIVVAAVGMGYAKGFSAVLFPAAWMVGDIIFWSFFAERINALGRKQGSITIPHLLGGGEQKRIVQLFSGLLVFFFLLVYASAQFTASGKVLSSFLSVSANGAMFFTFLFVVGYCFWGGFKASVWTDLLQGAMMLILTILGASVGAAMVWVSLGRAGSSGGVLVALFVGGAVALMWRVLGLHGRLNDGLVGFGVALLVSYLWMRWRDGTQRR